MAQGWAQRQLCCAVVACLYVSAAVAESGAPYRPKVAPGPHGARCNMQMLQHIMMYEG
jgi:hypothetical protein